MKLRSVSGLVVMAVVAGSLVLADSAAADEVISRSKTFDHTGAAQQWVVPAGVSSITITARGAEGGDSDNGAGPTLGGLGGEAIADISVTAGETLQINVGGAGSDGTNSCDVHAGGFNGGGTNSAGATDGCNPNSASGGGASDVRQNGTDLDDRVVVAGGGGGGSSAAPGFMPDPCSDCGGAGGGLNGDPGKTWSGGNGASGGGQTLPSGSNAYGEGGDGSLDDTGGGGGGYIGGAAMGVSGGGGGSGFGPVGTVFQTGVRSGNGEVVFDYNITLPTVTVDSNPKRRTMKRAAHFEFSASAEGFTFECRLDDADFEACTSPVDYTRLARKRHNFSVRAVATDGAEGTPVSFTWKILKR